MATQEEDMVRSEGQQSFQSNEMFIDDFQPRPPRRTTSSTNRKSALQTAVVPNVLKLVELISVQNRPKFAEYFSRKEIRALLLDNPSNADELADRINKVEERDYYILFLWTSLEFEFQEEFSKLKFYLGGQQASNAELERAIHQDETSYVQVVKAMINADEPLFWNLLIERTSPKDVLFKKPIIELLAAHGLDELMTQLFKSRRPLKKGKAHAVIDEDRLPFLDQLSDIVPILLRYKKVNIVLEALASFQMNPPSIFRGIIHLTHDADLIQFYRLFNNSLSPEDFDLLVSHQKYVFLLHVSKTVLAEGVCNIPIFEMMMDHLEKSMGSDQILLIVYKIRKLISNLEVVSLLYDSLSSLLSKKYTESALYLSENPIRFCIISHYLLFYLNKFLKIKNEDYSKLAVEFMKICDYMIQYLPHKALDAYTTTPDQLNHIFLDYMFKCKASKLHNSSYIENKIKSLWNKQIKYRLQLNPTYNIHYLSKNWFMRGKRFKEVIKIVDSRMTHFPFKFSIFKDSLSFRVYNQILENLMMLASELYYIFNLDSLLPVAPLTMTIFDILKTYNVGNLIFLLYCRISFFIEIVIKSRLHKNSSEMKALSYVYKFQLTMLSTTSIIVFTISSQSYLENQFIFTMLNSLPMFLMISELFILFLPIPEVGRILRIFLQMTKILLVFTFMSFFLFLLYEFFLNRFFINYNADFNIFKDIYAGTLTLYEFSMGALEFDKFDKSLYGFLMNIVLVIFAFLGNVMMVNILVAYLTTQFSNISDNALYFTLKTQFGYFKGFPIQRADFVYYMPFNTSPLFLIIYGLVKNPQKRKSLAAVFKMISHVIIVMVPLVVFFFLYNFVFSLLYYFKMIIKIAATEIKRPFFLLAKLITWVLAGMFLMIGFNFIDIYNIVRVNADYSFKDQDREQRDEEEMETKIEYKALTTFNDKLRTLDVTEPNVNKHKFLFDRLEDLDGLDESFYFENDFMNSEGMEETAKKMREVFQDLIENFSFRKEKDIDIKFMKQYFRQNFKEENTKMLLAYQLEKLVEAKIAATYEEETDIKINVKKLAESIAKLNDSIKDLK